MFKSFKSKLQIPFIILFFIIFVVFTVLVNIGFNNFYVNNLKATLGKQLLLNAHLFPDSLILKKDMRAIDEYCGFLDKYLKLRVTFIDTGGAVLGDSRVQFSALPFLDKHITRPEIDNLRNESVSARVRYSRTLGENMMYIACPVQRRGRTVSYIRFATPLSDIDRYLFRGRILLLGISFLIFILFIFISFGISNRVHNIINEIRDNAGFLESGKFPERKYLGYSPETDMLYKLLDEASDRIRKLIADLVRQREEIRALLFSVSEGVIAVNRKLNVLFANENACRIFGTIKPPGQSENVPLIGFSHHSGIREISEETFNQGGKIERSMVIHSGTSRYDVRVVSVPVYGKNSHAPELVMLTLVDLTEEKLLGRTKSDFVEAASHELKTPLTILKGYMETLENEDMDRPTMKEFIHRINKSIVRLENITNDLLQLATLESGKAVLPVKSCNIHDTIREILEDMEPLIREKRLTIENNCRLAIECIPELIYIVLYNLLSNAVKYNSEKGVIRISCSMEGNDHIISVEDSGIGIPGEHRERVFERFYRVDKHRSRESGGTGLGLAIVKHVVNTLNGSVHIKDGINGGIGFFVHLPVLVKL
ncbi:MAG: ATP-binding protein [bacterium]